jgi:hypothetical protein
VYVTDRWINDRSDSVRKTKVSYMSDEENFRSDICDHSIQAPFRSLIHRDGRSIPYPYVHIIALPAVERRPLFHQCSGQILGRSMHAALMHATSKKLTRFDVNLSVINLITPPFFLKRIHQMVYSFTSHTLTLCRSKMSEES